MYSHTKEMVGQNPPPAPPVQPGYENIFDGRGWGPYITTFLYNVPQYDEYGWPMENMKNWYGYPIVLDVDEYIEPSDFDTDGMVNGHDLFLLEQAIRNIDLGEFLSLYQMTHSDIDRDMARWSRSM